MTHSLGPHGMGGGGSTMPFSPVTFGSLEDDQKKAWTLEACAQPCVIMSLPLSLAPREY